MLEIAVETWCFGLYKIEPLVVWLNHIVSGEKESMKSNKAFTFEYVDQTAKTRVLQPDLTKYNPSEHFMYFEESDYLADALKGVPYATFKTDDRDEMENMLQNGFADASGRVWRSFFAYWKDQEGHAFLVPEDAFGKNPDLRIVGVNTEMKTPADFMKVGKYANRLFAALPKQDPRIDKEGHLIHHDSVWGKEIDFNAEEGYSLIQLELEGTDLNDDDKIISVKYVDLKTLSDEQKALVDGCIAINEKGARALNLSKEATIGMAWRGTFGTQRGLGKGHILYVPHLTHDVVIYGAKEILKTEKFFFGSMGELHVGTPHTDRQAFVNFHYHRDGLAVDLAKQYMRMVVEASRNEEKLRELFLKYSDNPAELDQEGWVLRRSLAYGISFQRFPGLFRRVVRYLLKKVMQCDERARIPMDSIAGYGYVLPDPNCIDSEGNVILENGIPEGTIVFPDVKPGTKIVCYRQPSENTNAWVALKVTHKPEFSRFAGRGICLLGRGAHKVLGRLGGGDMDDQFVIVHDQKWVEAFHTMRPYPETHKISAEVSEEEQTAFDQAQLALNEFTEELLYDIKDRNLTHYTNKHVSWQIEMAQNARAGIGPVVNFGMIDMLLSDPDHKSSMLKDLWANHPDQAEWLEEREPWQAALLMTNLELVIDGNVKDTTLLAKLGRPADTIKEFHKNCKVYPTCMANRIPASKQQREDYVFANSLMCKALAQIRALRERLQEIFVEREWALVGPADTALRAYAPFEREIGMRIGRTWEQTDGSRRRLVGRSWVLISDEVPESISDMWGRLWREEMAQDRNHDDAYDKIVKLIKEELLGEDDDMMERMSVELYYQLYRTYQQGPKTDEVTGGLRTYPDGLLWSPVFGNHFINALRKAGLAGFYKPVEIRPEFRRRLLGISTTVEVRGHRVYIQDETDQFVHFVGLVTGKSRDGRYRMDNGLIEYRRPQAICEPQDFLVVGQKPLTRIFQSKVEKAEPVKEQPESTGFGNMLGKALNVLGLKK